MKKSLRIVVKGRVQGVWFRKYTMEQALLLHINGWVMNLPDGSVAVHAEGLSEALEQFLAWCQKGSPNAEVTEVKLEATDFVGYSDFSIKR